MVLRQSMQPVQVAGPISAAQRLGNAPLNFEETSQRWLAQAYGDTYPVHFLTSLRGSKSSRPFCITIEFLMS